MTRFLFIIFSTVFLSACLGKQSPAPVISYGETTGVGSSGVHIVEAGDTLWSISQRYKIGMQDIVRRNRIPASFRLESGQRLNLPAPKTYKVRAGDSIYSVSRLFAVNQSEITRLNNLRAPYTIHEGQVLRMPSVDYVQPEQTARAGSGSAVKSAPPKPSSKITPAQRQKITAQTPARAGQFKKPVEGKVISRFGPKKGGLHNDGINISAPRGTPVRAAENGVVVYAGNELRGSGNLVLIRHQGRLMTAYAHMDKMMIKRGDVIKRGQTIGTVGSTGSVSTPQLHFEVRKGTQAINPDKYIGT